MGKPCPPTKELTAPGVAVQLDSERLQAQVTIARGSAITEEDVARALRSAGVVFGVDKKAIKLAITRRGQPVVVARGDPGEAGTPGRVVYECVDVLEGASFTPIEDEHGKVNARAGHVMPSVDAGQVLARLVAPEEGKAGRRVTGEPVPAERGKEIAVVVGPGTVFGADRKEILAARSGLPRVEANRFSVLPRCEVKSVDYASGDVYFAGSVTVWGDVLPGFKVVTTEDIHVQGTVELGELRAGGKITVVGGISHGAKLQALGDVAVRFVESECTIHSAGTITVRENALRSVLVGQRIVVGRHIVAGCATASELISAGMLGNESEVETLLILTREPHVSETRAAQLAMERTKGATDLARLRAAVRAAGRDGAILKRLVPQKVALELKLQELAHEATRGGSEVATESWGGTIMALTKMFAGVHATLYGHVHFVHETIGKKTLRVVDGLLTEDPNDRPGQQA